MLNLIGVQYVYFDGKENDYLPGHIELVNTDHIISFCLDFYSNNNEKYKTIKDNIYYLETTTNNGLNRLRVISDYLDNRYKIFFDEKNS